MPEANQLLLLVVAVGLLHAVVFALVVRCSGTGRSPESPRSGEGGRSALLGFDAEGGDGSPERESPSTTAEPAERPLDDVATVNCPACGAENETGYRYCRLCVSELRGGAAGVVGGGASAGDRTGR